MNRLNQQNPQHGQIQQYSTAAVSDIRGYRLFCEGEIGAAHRQAHEMFDRGELARGHRLLGRFLQEHTGSGGHWVHLQFHMALFELAAGDWEGAYTRFWHEVLPTATTTLDALTDAPGLLWRLQFTAPRGVLLPWEPLRQTALEALPNTGRTFVQVHNLLALAGAGDAKAITRWLTHQPGTQAGSDEDERLLRRIAAMCESIANRSYRIAGARMRMLRPELMNLKGSNAQLQLFDQLLRWIDHEKRGEPVGSDHLDAA